VRRESGIATEYVVIMILVALTAVLILANYGRNVGNQVDAAGGKIGTLGAADVEDGAAGGRGGAGSGGASSAGSGGGSGGGRDPSEAASAPRGGGPSGHRDGGGQPLPASAAEAAPPRADTATSRQLAIGGIILAAVGLLVAVRFSQSMRRMGEERQKKAQEALREERNRDVDEDTLSVKRSQLLGEKDEGEDDR
jgi:hypothetical protein